jgi:flagellar biosynthesis protein FlhB
MYGANTTSFFFWVVCTWVLICLALLMNVFSSLIFIYKVFLPLGELRINQENVKFELRETDLIKGT